MVKSYLWSAEFLFHDPSLTAFLEFPVSLQSLRMTHYMRIINCMQVRGGKSGKVLYFEDAKSYIGRVAEHGIKILV